jgi:aerobic carbon-monoxide dehydrogenase medium subunit
VVKHEKPATVDEACHALDEGAVPYRGGTVLFGAFEGSRPLPAKLVDVKGIGELHQVEQLADEIRVGAGSTLQSLVRHQLVQRTLPLLSAVCGTVGNIRVRSAGSIGGNLCAGEVSSDVLTALCAVQATVHLRTTTSDRSLPIEDFFLGHRRVDRRSRELMTQISIPVGHGGGWAYRKVQLTGRPSVSVAVSQPHGPGGTWRIVVGALGPSPAIIEQRSDASIAAAAVVADLPASDDHAADAAYKRHVAAVILSRALQDARRREQR